MDLAFALAIWPTVAGRSLHAQIMHELGWTRFLDQPSAGLLLEWPIAAQLLKFPVDFKCVFLESPVLGAGELEQDTDIDLLLTFGSGSGKNGTQRLVTAIRANSTHDLRRMWLPNMLFCVDCMVIV